MRGSAAARARGPGRIATCSSRSAYSTGSRAARTALRGFTGICAAGVRVGRKRVARLLKQAALRGVSRRKWPVTTVRAAHARPAPDLVQRAFTATGPNQLWVADITYIATWSGTLYLAVVLDVWSRRIIGWAMATHLRTSLVVTALEMAITQRRPQGVIHHSDQGCQYTAIEFGRRCREANVRPSMGSVGDCYDNAMCESFFATLECELLDRVTLRTPVEARTAVFDFIEGWYNPTRRHSSLDYESPVTFERRHTTTISQSTVLADPVDPGGYLRPSPPAIVPPRPVGTVELEPMEGAS